MLNYFKNRKLLLFKFGLVILVFLIIIIKLNVKGADVSEEIEEEHIEIKNINNLDDVPKISIKVDIKGAVLNPGVYELNEDNRVIDVINKAGGLITEADTSVINLSKKVEDQMVIIIYTKEEIENYINNINKESITNIVETISKSTTKCPDILINEGCLTQNTSIIENENIIENNTTTDITNKISINTSSASELDSLPGIGLTKAQAIIDYRNSNGLFSNIEDIMNVTGIGSSIFDQIKNLITV